MDSDKWWEELPSMRRRARAYGVQGMIDAAKNAPNLTHEDRYRLILDALDRAKEAGIIIEKNDFIKEILYGKNYD